jgi:Ulp1 family protease
MEVDYLITYFQIEHLITLTLSRIVNIGGNHWICLVLNKASKDENWQAFYMDSLGSKINDEVVQALEISLSIEKNQIHNLSFTQQTDGHNCGVYALENLDIINNGLRSNLDHNKIQENIKNSQINCDELRKNWSANINWN